MRLTTYSDYALRCLIYLATQEDKERLMNIQILLMLMIFLKTI
ncbi:hypothetical protein OURE66S_00233 [Oligella ureolytica]